ncbi:MAG: hypothetical protein WDM89_04830 [Rhizomicrobium sp.]
MIASICGSLVLALAVADKRLSAGEAFALSQIDERFQAEKWGLDSEAEARAKRLEEELVTGVAVYGPFAPLTQWSGAHSLTVQIIF